MSDLRLNGREFYPRPPHCRRLQSVQNAAARLVSGARRRDHITPVLQQLHWLPVRQRIEFKVAGLVHQSLAGVTPAYLADDCCLLSDAGRRPLRSDSNELWNLLVPHIHSKLGDRSFSFAGPLLWNDLPPRLRRPGLSFDTVKQSLKTHLFGDQIAYSDSTEFICAIQKTSFTVWTYTWMGRRIKTGALEKTSRATALNVA